MNGFGEGRFLSTLPVTASIQGAVCREALRPTEECNVATLQGKRPREKVFSFLPILLFFLNILKLLYY